MGSKPLGSGIRRVGSGIKSPGIRDLKGGSWDQNPWDQDQITSHGIRISRNFRDQGSGCAIFVRSGITIFIISRAFRTRDHNFENKKWDY